MLTFRPLLGQEKEKFQDIKHISINSNKSLEISKPNGKKYLGISFCTIIFSYCKTVNL